MKRRIAITLFGLLLASGAAAQTMDDINVRADAGDAEAQLQMGNYYDPQYGGPFDPHLGQPDRATAIAWYSKAAQQGVDEAGRRLCGLYFSASPRPDWANIVAYCAKAAETGDPAAISAMGVAYAQGKGNLTPDPVKAFGYLSQPVTQTYPLAVQALAILYFDGAGAPQDYAQSAKLFRASLNEPSGTSMWYLGRQYEQGLGVATEPLEAERLYGYAARAGHPDAAAWLTQHPAVAQDLMANRLEWPEVVAAHFTMRGVLPDGSFGHVSYQYVTVNLGDYYPARATDDEVEGTVIADCHWNGEGRLDNCIIDTEEPANYGFGKATLMVLRHTAIPDEKDAFIALVKGRSAHLTIKWLLG